MTTSESPDDQRERSIWTREPARDRRRNTLTREAITAAAISLADAEGLEAVTIRRVAGELNARPMSLYSHIERKDDLLELMLDSVAGDGLLVEVPGDWRAALTAIARATRRLCQAHPWVVDALTQRPMLGPNGVAHAEQSLAAVSGLDIDLARKRQILWAVDTYTVGNVIAERLGVGRPRWSEPTDAYLSELVASGEFPNLEPVGADAFLTGDEDRTDGFETGLRWLLDGISASLAP